MDFLMLMYARMPHGSIHLGVPEESIPTNDDVVELSDRGVAAYRCKIYKALLHATSDRDYGKRPLVDRSARWITQTHRT